MRVFVIRARHWIGSVVVGVPRGPGVGTEPPGDVSRERSNIHQLRVLLHTERVASASTSGGRCCYLLIPVLFQAVPTAMMVSYRD